MGRSSPRLSKAGWMRRQEIIPVPLKGADGAVVKVAQPPNRRSRSAPNQKERFADVNSINRPVCAGKEASRHFLDGAATPPWKGGDYRADRMSLYGFSNTLP